MAIQELLKKMTLAEKIGQLVQLTPNFFEAGAGEITGPKKELGLSYVHSNLERSTDKGDYQVFIGADCLGPEVGQFTYD